VIEGRAEDVDALLDDIQHAMRCSIAAVDTTHGPATGEFEGFTIRR
jgi:hypothetical protein